MLLLQNTRSSSLQDDLVNSRCVDSQISFPSAVLVVKFDNLNCPNSADSHQRGPYLVLDRLSFVTLETGCTHAFQSKYNDSSKMHYISGSHI